MKTNTERRSQRLEAQHEGKEDWRLWGPYLAERAWGTVREDYSPGGTAWEDFDHDQSRCARLPLERRRHGRHLRRASAPVLRAVDVERPDPILKERAFGLTGNQGNHGEDVKEYYFYLDATPSHSWMRYLYKYPQAEYPVRLAGGREPPPLAARPRRSRLLDTGVFNDGRYFDVEVRYAKASPEEMHIRVIATNRGPEAAPHSSDPEPVVPQHVVLGRSGRQAGAAGRSRRPRAPMGGAGRSPDARHLLFLRPPRGQGAVHREREQRAAPVERAERFTRT